MKKRVLFLQLNILLLLTTILPLFCYQELQLKNSPLKILHLSFHLGCIKDFEEVAQELGLNVTSWYIKSADLPPKYFDGKSIGAAEYNIGHERARMVWEKHKTYFDQFDIILTSDTAPLSRIFLQNGWKKPLIIWICNRFDYHDQASLDCVFPDKEYYDLFRKAACQSNVKIISYTPYEHVYAKRKGVDVGTFTIKPLGSMEKGGRDGEKSAIPTSVNKAETLFLYPRLNSSQLNYINRKCAEQGLKIYSGRYNGPNDLTGFKGILYFPYAWSNLALFENFQRGIVHFVPSEKFIAQEYRNVRYVTCSEFNLVEWYREENRPYIVYFDSWEDLKLKVNLIDYTSLQEKIKQFGTLHRATMLDRWRDVFDGFYRAE